jgi:hypothetical protein
MPHPKTTDIIVRTVDKRARQKFTARQLRRPERDQRRGSGAPRWLSTLELMIPKSVREPWFGDLIEDRVRLVVAGQSRAAIELSSAFQVILILVHWTVRVTRDLTRPLR